MPTILEIIDLILAIELWLEEVHLSAVSYTIHLLAERLQENFAEHKDAIREIALSDESIAQKEEIFSAVRNAKSALEILYLIPAQNGNRAEAEYLNYTKQLYQKLLETASAYDTTTPLRKELDDLCAKLARDLYLIDQTLKGLED